MPREIIRIKGFAAVRQPFQAETSARRNLINLLGIRLIAIVFSDFDSPLRLTQMRKKSLLPLESFVAHPETRRYGTTGLIQLPRSFIDGSVSTWVASPSDQYNFSTWRMMA